MKDGFEIAEMMQDRIQDDYAEDVAIAACYGFYARGTARPDSDPDFFFRHCTAQGYAAGLQFASINCDIPDLFTCSDRNLVLRESGLTDLFRAP